MKIIADGGATTKNTGANTRDAIILGLNTPYINGFKFKLYLTRDNEIVSLSDPAYLFFEHFENGISNLTLKEALTYNVGTKVQPQQIITLKEILTIFQNYPNKDLILELTNHKQKNGLFTDLILVELRKYPYLNIYLETEFEEIFSYLKSSTTKYPLGYVVRENSVENFDKEADFYDIALVLLEQLDIRSKALDGYLIMLDQINVRSVFDLVYQEYQDIFDNLFIITSKISNINNDLVKK